MLNTVNRLLNCDISSFMIRGQLRGDHNISLKVRRKSIKRSFNAKLLSIEIDHNLLVIFRNEYSFEFSN